VILGQNCKRKKSEKKVKKYFVIFTAFLLIACPAITAAEMTGKELLEKCEPLEKLKGNAPSLSSKEATGIVYCLGYIDSFIDTFNFQVRAKIVPSVPYCLPIEKQPRKKYAEDVVNYMKSDPEELGKPAGYYIFMGLRDAYPCNKEDGQGDASDASQSVINNEKQVEPRNTSQPDSKK